MLDKAADEEEHQIMQYHEAVAQYYEELDHEEEEEVEVAARENPISMVSTWGFDDLSKHDDDIDSE